MARTRLLEGLLAVILASVLAVAAKPVANAAVDSSSAVVIVNLDNSSGQVAPTVEQLSSRPTDVAKRYRVAGLNVATDPTGRVLAVTGLSPLLTNVSRYSDLSDRALAAAVLQQTTPQQVAQRNKGYLSANTFTESQNAAVQEIAKRRGLLKSGVDSIVDSHLVVGIWNGWTIHLVTAPSGAAPLCRKLDLAPTLPTEGIIEAPSLSGSPLWFAWAEQTAEWGKETVDLPSGTYTVEELAKKLSLPGGLALAVDSSASNMRVSAVAVNAPVKAILWALQTATGLDIAVTKAATGLGEKVTIGGRNLAQGGANKNSLLPIPHVGYYSAAQSIGGRSLLMRTGDDEVSVSPEWGVWRLADLPLMYRNEISDAWNVTRKRIHEEAAAFDAERTYVLWTKSITVAIEAQSKDGGGTGVEFIFPVF